MLSSSETFWVLTSDSEDQIFKKGDVVVCDTRTEPLKAGDYVIVKDQLSASNSICKVPVSVGCVIIQKVLCKVNVGIVEPLIDIPLNQRSA